MERATLRCQSRTLRASFAVEAVVMVVGATLIDPLRGGLRAYRTSSMLPSRSVDFATAESAELWITFVEWWVLDSSARL